MICGVSTEGDLHCWDPLLEPEALLPVPEEASQGIQQVDAGSGAVCAVHDDGAVSCWGSGTALDEHVGGPFAGVTVAQSAWWACGRRASGFVSCWGNDNVYQDEMSSPMTLFHQIDAASSYACGVREADGHLSCWGEDHAFAVDDDRPRGRPR